MTSVIRVVVLCSLVFFSSIRLAESCGYHDPTQLAQGILNHMYPNALHVTGAIQRARRLGQLPPLDSDWVQATGEARKELDRLAFQGTLKAVHALGAAIEQASGNSPHPPVSIVVIKHMLWSRFSGEYLDVRQGLHVKGPVAGDVVLVTDEPVVLAIQSGSLSIDHAVELGVIRAYGTDYQPAETPAFLGAIGEDPLPRPELPTPGDNSLFDMLSVQNLQ